MTPAALFDRRLHVAYLQRLCAGTTPYVDIETTNEPWTPFDRLTVASLASASVVLIAADINTVAQVLINSGLVGFESYSRAALFSLIPIGVAFAVKSFRRGMTQEADRRLYEKAVWGVGLLSGVAWARLFAATFPRMTQSVTDVLSELSAATSSPQVSSAGTWLIFFTLMAGAFLAGGCWLTIETIVESHRHSRRVNNQQHAIVQKDLSFWTKLAHDEMELLGQVHGRLKAIEAGLKEFLEQAVSFYDSARKGLYG